VGRYTVETLLGRGGMGEVYRAHDERLDRPVALKLLPVARGRDTRAQRRLVREARAAAALCHPGVVTVHEIGEDRGRTFIVMELVEGETLKAHLERRGRLPPGEAVELVAQIADAVHALHQAGFVHRDLKPANLILDRRGRIKILDFGLSKRLTSHPRAETEHDSLTGGPPLSGPPAADDAGPVDGTWPTVYAAPAFDACPAGSDEMQTAAGVILGTPGYAAVELMDGAPAGIASDVFALAVIAYELVTGRRPFGSADLRGLRLAVAHGFYAPASRTSQGAVGASFDRALAPALSPRPGERPDSVVALVTSLRAALVPAAPPARFPRATGGLLAGTLAAGLSLWPGPREPPGRLDRSPVSTADGAERTTTCDRLARAPTVETCER
jgi:serine/threonine-protein kinase